MQAMSGPASGPEWWISGLVGKLSPWSHAKVFALIKVSDELELGLKDPTIASMVERVGGGNPSANTMRTRVSVFVEAHSGATKGAHALAHIHTTQHTLSHTPSSVRVSVSVRVGVGVGVGASFCAERALRGNGGRSSLRTLHGIQARCLTKFQ